MATEKDGRTVLNTPLRESEPCFILRGNDMLAADTVRCWIKLAKEAGVNQQAIESARSILRRMEDWPFQYVPD